MQVVFGLSTFWNVPQWKRTTKLSTVLNSWGHLQFAAMPSPLGASRAGTNNRLLAKEENPKDLW
eukprot:2892320-Amphidinium_carterae.1